MPPKRDQWFVAERSQARASLLLTDRSDLEILNQRRQADGAEFIVSLREGAVASNRHFAVLARGTLSTDRRQWIKTVKPLFRAGNSYLPTCVFVINVRDNTTSWAWVARPEVTETGRRMDFFEGPEFQPLDEDAVEEIVEQVRLWYDAIERTSVSHAS